MSKKLFLGGLTALLVVSACTSHRYQLVGVERTRIVIDSRYDTATDEKAAQFLAPFKRVNDSIMNPVIGSVAHDMRVDRPESDLSNLMSDILVWAAAEYGEQPVLGVYNMGGIRADLTRGIVTYGDILDMSPFDNKICFLTLTGEHLLELFEQIVAAKGEGVSKGVELVSTKDYKMVSARLHGQPVDPKGSYRVVTNDFLLTGNDKMGAFLKGTDVRAPSESTNNVRHIVVRYFRDKASRGEVVDAQVEGRFRFM
ncbi:MAG: 5'-nucleotidase C-terminal domain-containing protein [Prevotella sp.]|nr:5'-nucleotidase C-terminal domain-containing protein [Prevotella sp.]